jgi:hypothetical protein
MALEASIFFLASKLVAIQLPELGGIQSLKHVADQTPSTAASKSWLLIPALAASARHCKASAVLAPHDPSAPPSRCVQFPTEQGIFLLARSSTDPSTPVELNCDPDRPGTLD